MQKKEERGITLIALVVTIVVLLILAGTSIAMLRGDNGIVTQAQKSKIETRGGEVEERIGLWKNEYKYSDTEVPGEDDFIESLKEEKLIYDEEIDTQNKIITIGSRNIYYGLKDPVALITFTIEGKEYTAEDGMTWEEWCSSKYNTDGYKASTYTVTLSGTDRCVAYNTERIGGSEKIVNGRAYTTKGVAECVYPNSNILITAEGQTNLAKNIKENDEIMYFDFDKNTIKSGKVSKVYIHKNATKFVKYIFEDGSYLEATDYHPIYTKEGWKSLTNRNGYETPKEGDLVKTADGWKKITKIETFTGEEDCYDFEILAENGKKVDNYFANGTLVQGSY